MTQQEQQEFMERLEGALSWMKDVEERLRTNDNTQGPWDALEGRLRETEKIHQSQHEGRVKMDMALVAAEHLLEMGDEDLRATTHAKLKDLKICWEETCTYIVHCHSRIEWVWLHWSEYMKAYEEFMSWLTRQQCSLDVALELQLGLKEKLWHVDQQRVVLSDIHGQAALLERLLDEAAALHSRIQDPCVDPEAQGRLQEAYKDIRGRAEERLSLLEKIAEEHHTYQGCLQRFQSWLLAKTKEVTDLMERDHPTENKLQALQALDDSVASEEKALQYIEGVSEGVRANSSPAGAEVVMEEAEELRLGWQRLRQGLCEAEEGLRSSLDARCEYALRCQRLGEDVGLLRVRLQGLDRELEEGADVGDEYDSVEELLGSKWRKYTGVRDCVAAEESRVEQLKSQLKHLFRFSEDSGHISDDVLVVVKEHQSVKCKAARLCSESERVLRNALQDPLLSFGQWSHEVSEVLEASAMVTDFSHIVMLLNNMERLLKDSFELQERFKWLKTKEDLLEPVFGPEGSAALHTELSASMRNRELLHAQLLQRKGRLQGFISRTKDFGDASTVIVSKLSNVRERVAAAEGLQPDILAKKSQWDHFKAIQKELEECDAHLTSLETLISSSQSNRTEFEKISADWKHLCKAVRVKLRESEEGVAEHECFHDSLLNVEKCLMVMKQKMDSFKSAAGDWSVAGRQHEAEKALAEFPEKELQLQQMEVQGQRVLRRTSQEGRVHILGDIKRLQEAWLALRSMSLNIDGLLSGSTEQTDSHVWKVSMEEVDAGPHAEGHLLLPAQLSGKHSHHAGDGDGSSALPAAQQTSTPVDKQQRLLGRTGTSSSGTKDTMNSEEAGMMKEEGLHHSKGAFVLLTPGSAQQQDATATQGSKDTGPYESRRRQFEAWLCRENQLLSGILSTKRGTLKSNQGKMQQDTLKALRAGLPWGQKQLQILLQESKDTPAQDAAFEELHYRWILYKSKLNDVGALRTRVASKSLAAKQKDLTPKATKWVWLQRVCGLALPVWLLLLALVLLAFLLPIMDQDSSCSLSNNFARSFNVMLRYSGPPPT
ncbi:nesprin-3 isoform X2 [Dunckerocampus dactyliophorus]|uniref:nesprin-3 isoform X2 n=1 Tax=Dunckerocampus dactyliophorus TaxID=161453 RepID=UPI0024059C98|nr:nesprin-3 isoform X2 [Dunckerocampus dactyliophorus]